MQNKTVLSEYCTMVYLHNWDWQPPVLSPPISLSSCSNLFKYIIKHTNRSLLMYWLWCMIRNTTYSFAVSYVVSICNTNVTMWLYTSLNVDQILIFAKEIKTWSAKKKPSTSNWLLLKTTSIIFNPYSLSQQDEFY